MPLSIVPDLLQTAVRTDGKGQLNISKLLRASAKSLAQAAAAELGFPDDRQQLAQDLLDLSHRLGAFGVEASICERLALGADQVARGGMSSSEQFPDPYVCRRCGVMTDGVPTESCHRCGAHQLTFERFAPVYWLDLYGTPDVVERLAANPDKMIQAVERIPKHNVTWTPQDTSWSATDIMRHVRDADALLRARVDLILDEDDPPLAFKAVYALTPQEEDAIESIESIIESYVQSRAASVARLNGIGSTDWMRTGRHQELGHVTLLQQASYFAAHELTHLRQLEQLRRAVSRASQT